MDQMDTRFEILFKLLPLLDNSTAVLPEVKILPIYTEKIRPKAQNEPNLTQNYPTTSV